MSPKLKRYFLTFLTVFFIVSIILATFNLVRNFNKPRLQTLPIRELRGVWISRFDYAERFPSHNQDSIKLYISNTFKAIKEANFNTVFFQVRGNADVLYQSKIEPWSALLTGELGKDPGWDPLAYAVSEAHKLGLELHAWINVFPAWRGKQPPKRTQPLHPYLAHPEWLVCDSTGKPMPLSDHYVSFSPGIPQVHKHLLRIITEIVNNYDIDGIHFDYIRYPEGSPQYGYSHDIISRQRFITDNPQNLNWEDWQREQVTTFIAKAYDLITSSKPYLKVSAAVIGYYKNAPWNAYNAVYQDARRWAEIDKIDWIIPMMYFGRFERGNSFTGALKEWKNQLDNQRPFFPGIGAYRLEWQEVLDEIDDIRNAKLPGLVIFSISSLDSIKLAELKKLKFLYLSLPPASPWKSKQLPKPPQNVTYKKEKNQIILSWEPPANDPLLKYFVVYKSRSSKGGQIAPENILAILNANQCSIALNIKEVRRKYIYLTSVNRFDNESEPSTIINF